MIGEAYFVKYLRYAYLNELSKKAYCQGVNCQYSGKIYHSLLYGRVKGGLKPFEVLKKLKKLEKFKEIQRNLTCKTRNLRKLTFLTFEFIKRPHTRQKALYSLTLLALLPMQIVKSPERDTALRSCNRLNLEALIVKTRQNITLNILMRAYARG